MWQLTLSAQYLQHLVMGIILFSLCQIIYKMSGGHPLPSKCAHGVAKTLFKVMIIIK